MADNSLRDILAILPELLKVSEPGSDELCLLLVVGHAPEGFADVVEVVEVRSGRHVAADVSAILVRLRVALPVPWREDAVLQGLPQPLLLLRLSGERGRYLTHDEAHGA